MSRESQTALVHATSTSLFTALNSQRVVSLVVRSIRPCSSVRTPQLLRSLLKLLIEWMSENIARIRSETGVIDIRAAETVHVRVCHRHASARRDFHRVISDISKAVKLYNNTDRCSQYFCLVQLIKWSDLIRWRFVRTAVSSPISKSARCPRSSTGVSQWQSRSSLRRRYSVLWTGRQLGRTVGGRCRRSVDDVVLVGSVGSVGVVLDDRDVLFSNEKDLLSVVSAHIVVASKSVGSLGEFELFSVVCVLHVSLSLSCQRAEHGGSVDLLSGPTRAMSLSRWCNIKGSTRAVDAVTCCRDCWVVVCEMRQSCMIFKRVVLCLCCCSPSSQFFRCVFKRKFRIWCQGFCSRFRARFVSRCFYMFFLWFCSRLVFADTFIFCFCFQNFLRGCFQFFFFEGVFFQKLGSCLFLKGSLRHLFMVFLRGALCGVGHPQSLLERSLVYCGCPDGTLQCSIICRGMLWQSANLCGACAGAPLLCFCSSVLLQLGIYKGHGCWLALLLSAHAFVTLTVQFDHSSERLSLCSAWVKR